MYLSIAWSCKPTFSPGTYQLSSEEEACLSWGGKAGKHGNVQMHIPDIKMISQEEEGDSRKKKRKIKEAFYHEVRRMEVKEWGRMGYRILIEPCWRVAWVPE